LGIKGIEEKRRDVGANWENLKSAKIQEAAVFKAANAQFKEYTEQLFTDFREYYKEHLEALLYDPYSLFKTTLIGVSADDAKYTGSSQRKPMFEPRAHEVQARIEELKREAAAKASDSDSGSDDDSADEDSADDSGDSAVEKMKRRLNEARAKAGSKTAGEAEPEDDAASSEDEKCEAGEDDKHVMVAQYEAQRCTEIETRIDELFTEPVKASEKKRWNSSEQTGKSVQSLTKLLYRFARARIADGLSAQIHRFFLKPVQKGSALTKHMQKMEDDCFTPNQKVIDEETEKRNLAKAAQEKVQALLDEATRNAF